jgi:glycosyltransferase involved in cell wall biosynthesis
LILAGDGPAKAAVEARAAELGVADVSFPGYVQGPDKAQELLDADLYVLATYHGEGCPVSLLEAMAAGVPCITSTIGGIPDVFQDGVNGLMLETVTVASVEEALDKLLGDPEKRSLIGAGNRVEAWEKYESHNATPRIESLYERVAESDERQ